MKPAELMNKLIKQLFKWDFGERVINSGRKKYVMVFSRHLYLENYK